MKPTSPTDGNIPVLTEIIHPEDIVVLTETIPAQQLLLSQDNLAQLEKTLRENVLRQLLTRVDFVLEHRVRDGLADVLQTAVDHLAQEIRTGLSKSLEELIHRTVTQELSKIQSTKI